MHELYSSHSSSDKQSSGRKGEFESRLLKAEIQLQRLDGLLLEIQHDITSTPLLFSILQFLAALFLFFVFTFGAFFDNSFLPELPTSLVSILVFITGIWSYFSYISIRYSYVKYRIAKKNLIRADAIRGRTKQLIRTINNS